MISEKMDGKKVMFRNINCFIFCFFRVCQGANEEISNLWPVPGDPVHPSGVCKPSSNPRGVSLHEGHNTPQHRWETANFLKSDPRLNFYLMLTFFVFAFTARGTVYSVANRDVKLWRPFTAEPHNKGSVVRGDWTLKKIYVAAAIKSWFYTWLEIIIF